MIHLARKVLNRINAYRKISQGVAELHGAVKRYLPKNPIVVEAGAHEGYDTLALATIWPQGKIYAFEPVPILFKELKQRVRNKRNVGLFNVALGEDTRLVKIYISSGDSNGSSSVLKPSGHLKLYPGVAFSETMEVPMISLNEWSMHENIARVDLMWLDMQGYEINALRGASRLLQSVSVVYTELCRSQLYDGMTTQDEYISFLESCGFKLMAVKGDLHEEVSDGIFVRQ